MIRASVAALLCSSATAQQVAVGCVPSLKTPADQAVGKPYGSGTLAAVADWLAQPQADYFAVPDFASGFLELTPEAVVAPAGRGSVGCYGGWAKVAGGVCLDEWSGLGVSPPNPQAWTNRVTQGDDLRDVPVYSTAAGCEGGASHAAIDVKFDGTTITVDLSGGGKNTVEMAFVHVGQEPLPRDKAGQYAWAVTGFPVMVEAEDNPVVTFEGVQAEAVHWFAVSLTTCAVEKNEPPPPRACPSTFYVTQYTCVHGPCTEGVSGGLGALLVADGWEAVKASSVSFTTAETGDFPHEARMFRRELAEKYSTPPTAGSTRYVGVFATGCGERVVPPPLAPKQGPIGGLCRSHCPPGAAGFFLPA